MLFIQTFEMSVTALIGSNEGIAMPVFQALSTELITMVTLAAGAVPDESDVSDEFIRIAEKVDAVAVASDATILIPEPGPAEIQQNTFSFLARRPTMFCVLVGKPGLHLTFAKCTEYSEEYGERPFALGTLISFPSPSSFIVAKTIPITSLKEVVTDLRKRPLEESLRCEMLVYT